MMIHRIVNEFSDPTPADYDAPVWDNGISGNVNEGDRYMEMGDEWLGYLRWLETIEFRAGQ